MVNKNCSKNGEHITVINENLSEFLRPMCIHGPTLLFKKTFDNGTEPNQFYACSAFRNPKECPILTGEQVVLNRAHLQSHSESVHGLSEIAKLSPKKRAYCHTCSCLFTTREKKNHQNHDFLIGISDDLLCQPTRFLKPLSNDTKEAQYFFADSTLQCIVNIFKELSIRSNKMILSELRIIFMLNIVADVISWPTVKLKVLHYKYNIIEPDIVNFNITERNGQIIAYYELKRESSFLFVNTVIDFEDKKNEFGIEFMNTTTDICKMINNRRYDPLVGLLFAALQEKVPILPKKCPFKKRPFTIPLSGFETNKMPPIWPENAVRFTTRQYLNEKKILKEFLIVWLTVKFERK